MGPSLGGFRCPWLSPTAPSPAPAASCTPGAGDTGGQPKSPNFVPPIHSADIIARGVGGAGWAVGGAPRGAEGAEVENRPPAAPFKMGGLGGQASVPAA